MVTTPTRARLREDRTEDETFIFLMAQWNVSQALELVKDREPSTCNLGGVFKMLPFVRTHEEIIAKADLSYPIIVADLGEFGHLVIDGWHRIAKAQREGITQLPAHLLTPEEESLVRISGEF